MSVEIAGRLTARQRVLLVALLSTAAVVYALPVGRRPIGIADEARQALLAEDTLRHGLRLPARVREEPYLHKPPLFFWSVALAAMPAGHVSDRNASIPSVVAALAALLGVFFLGRQLSGAQAWMAGFLLLLELSVYQRAHYLLPVYPLFALFVAASVTTAASRARSLLWIHAMILVAVIATALAVGGWLLLTPRISLPTFVSARSWEAAGLAGLALAGSATALWLLLSHRSPSRALSWLAATLALVLLLGSGIYSAGLASTYSIQAFADGVRGSLERDGPITAYPDGNLVFDLYLDRPIVEVTDRGVIARRLEGPSAGELLLQVNDWAALRQAAHPSWCSMGSVALGSRFHVLLGRCR